MIVLTIPRKMATEGDLVLIPRKEYEEIILRVKLADAITSYQKGNYRGPFGTVAEGRTTNKHR